MITHSADRPFKCELCQKAFKLRKQLTLHLWTHTGNKPHKCHLCHKSFISSQHLKEHVRVHTGLTPFKCQLCQKSYSQRSSLNKHNFRAHAGYKWYKCQLCSRAFAFPNDLNMHLLTHNVDDQRNNNMCEKEFEHSFTDVLDEYVRCHTTKKRTQTAKSLNTAIGSEHNLFSNNAADTGVGLRQDTQYVRNEKPFVSCYKLFLTRPYGCGICGEMFEIETDFVEHCSMVCFFPVEYDCSLKMSNKITLICD